MWDSKKWSAMTCYECVITCNYRRGAAHPQTFNLGMLRVRERTHLWQLFQGAWQLDSEFMERNKLLEDAWLLRDSWWEAAEPETTNPPRSKSCPKLPSWSVGPRLWAERNAVWLLVKSTWKTKHFGHFLALIRFYAVLFVLDILAFPCTEQYNIHDDIT